ncbi:uncharacterized protein LOC135372775 [Ornithodoros turicata]|uniref:uncharacterized protein LOC135372775 n=1 Tax=Ornithodoros turicata TaxID=34597 RepID=UPI00313897BD
MVDEDCVPFSYNELGWVRDLSPCDKVTVDEVWRYLGRTTSTLRQAHRGWAFKEEGHIRNVMVNEDTENGDFVVIRATCTPSMKKGDYPVTAWYGKNDGRILGASCRCVAGETCHHVAAMLFHVADAARTTAAKTCTDLPCAWIVPPQGRKPLVPAQLNDIPFQKFLVNKPTRETRKQVYNPAQHSQSSDSSYTELVQDMADCCSNYKIAPTTKKDVSHQQLPIDEDASLTSEVATQAINNYCAMLKIMSPEECKEITARTVGQAENGQWHKERIGWITSSVFKRAVRCKKPEGLSKQLLYPKQSAYSEAIVYGRKNEAVAVKEYVKLMAAYEKDVSVQVTGLHIHDEYPFLAASPDRIVRDGSETGLLQVKCPFSKVGVTPLEACKDKNFCCRLINGEVQLRRDHAYYYQVQGQLAVTGFEWCDFVAWTNAGSCARSLPTTASPITTTTTTTLLHFVKYALVPEMLTQHVRRIGQLYTKGSYPPYEQCKKGYYICEPCSGLKMKFRRIE